MKHTSNSNSYLIVLVVFIAMLMANLAIIPTNIMEARNLVSAREMVEDGNWIFTTLNGLPRYEKPPLPTWITAVFGKVVGFEDFFWLRLPVVMITGLMSFFFYKISNELKLSQDQIINSLLVLFTSFYIFFAGRDNNWDMYTHAFMMGTIFFLFKQFQQTKTNIGALIGAIFLLACSIMSKGPVSLYALLLPFLFAYFMVFKGNWKKNIASTVGVVILGCLLGFAWMWYVKSHDPETFARVAKKEVNNWHSYNTRPIYYYWSFFTQSGIWTVPAVISLIYPYLKNKVSNPKQYRFVWLWTILSVVLLSIIPEKKSRYLLPVLIPLAMNIGFYIEYLKVEFHQIRDKRERYSIYFTFGLYVIVATIVAFSGFVLFKEIFLRSFFNPLTKYVGGLFILGLSCAYFIFKGLKSKEFKFIFYPVIILMCGVMFFGLPLLPMYKPNTLAASAKWLKEFEKTYHVKTYEANNAVPEIILQYGQPIEQLLKLDDVVILPKEDRFGMTLSKKDSTFIKDHLKGYQVKAVGFIDLNTTESSSKSYNERLAREYYLVEKVKNSEKNF